MKQKKIILNPYPRGYHLITDIVESQLVDHLPMSGILHLFIQHTSASIAINEAADSEVREDFEKVFNYLIPENLPFLKHTAEGPDDMPAHIKAAIMGCDLMIPISNHRLNLGVWQGIYLCEFRNHGTSRHLIATIIT